MSQAREPLPLGPEGPEHAASAAASSVAVSLPRKKRDEDQTAREKMPEHSSNQNIQADLQDQPTWGNYTGDDLIRTQPQPLRQPNALPLEKFKKETGNTENSNTSLSYLSRICTGVGVDVPDNRTFSAPVSQKLQRKIQSSLSVNTENSKKSSAYSPKPGSLHGDCCVHCILACLFCEFVTLCSLILDQTTCGICPTEACCCCCWKETGEGCNCPCDTDCGVMDACCESADCLEFCMECCGICFPS